VSRRHLSYAIVAIAVVAAIGGDARALLVGEGSGALGKPAPPLPAHVLVPPRASIASLRGRPVAISFWASWCVPCRQEAPGLARLSRELRGRASLIGADWGDERDATVILDRAGRISGLLQGPQTANDVERALGIHAGRQQSTPAGADR
jgi:cytochrome c biogenesis protein CcmG/thiol:disulfide interchange protein DsbE